MISDKVTLVALKPASTPSYALACSGTEDRPHDEVLWHGKDLVCWLCGGPGKQATPRACAVSEMACWCTQPIP